jgi:hypothetical protein
MAIRVGRIAAGLLFLAVLTGHPSAERAWGQEAFRLTSRTRFLLGMETFSLGISGHIVVPAGGRPGSGTRVELLPDLGIDQGEGSAVSFQATVFENHIFQTDFLMATPTGVVKPPHDFCFQNRTYLKGVPLEARLDFNWLRCAYGYKALDLRSFWVAPTLGLHHVRCSSTINGDTKEEGIVSNTRSLDGTFPVMGVEGRYLFPYGLDLGLEFEGIHLLDRGFLGAARLRCQWEIHPDVVLSTSVWHRVVQTTENNQELNNQWSYHLTGWSAGIAFGF